jgi:hypothetical protein
MNNQEQGTRPPIIHGLLDLAPIAAVGPARIPLGTQDEVIQVAGDPFFDNSAKIHDDFLEVATKVSLGSAGETKFSLGEFYRWTNSAYAGSSHLDFAGALAPAPFAKIAEEI